jgi:hypothetical protein
MRPTERARRTRAALAALTLALFVAGEGDAADRGLSRLGTGSSAQEYWDIVARFDSNYSLFTRFLITNEGPGERTAVASWYLVAPDGVMVPFRNGRRRSRWSLSSDGARIEIGSSVFDQRGSVHSLEYESGKRGIRVKLRFTPEGPVARADLGSAGDYAVDLLDVGTPVVGTIWLEGMAEPLAVSGSISVTHNWMERSETDLALRRIDFSSEDQGDASVYLSHLTEPSGERHSWLVVERRGGIVHRTEAFEVEVEAERVGSAPYPLPTRLKIVGDGIEGTITPGPRLVQVDPLRDIPQPFRFLLSFKTRPQRVWAQASYQVTIRADPDLPAITLQGNGIATVTYLNPLPKTISQFEAGETGNPGA